MELQDKIGREPIVNKISTLINNLTTNEHFCLALDGEWGSGKSFVLDMLYERLQGNDSHLVVRYDAWECSFYDEPLVAILSSIVDSAFDKLPTLPGGKQAIKRGGKKLGMSILEELSSKTGKLGFLATIVKKIIAHISSFKESMMMDTKDGKVAEFKSYQAYLKDVKDSLNEFTAHKDGNGKQNKLIILVDELDRCLPDMQLKILERLHHLFDIKNCVVVCAINADSVAQNVRTTYGVDGFEYLRKFFDYIYRIQKSTSEYLATLLSDLAKLTQKMNEYAKNASEPTTLAHMCLNYGTYQTLSYIDNREVTRFYKSILQICDDFGWENLSPQYLFFVIVGLYLKKYVFSDFLTENDILTKNKDIRQKMFGATHEMPYYDYLLHYLGIDRVYLLDQMITVVGEKFPEYSWNFNEMVYRSIGKTSAGDFDKEKCMRLRELILLYGGEPKIKEAKN